MSETKKVGTLIKTLGVKRKIDDSTEYDTIVLFYRDEFGNKKVKYVPRAEVPFYILNDPSSKEAEAPPMFIEAEKVTKHMAYSDMLYREIAAKTDSLAYYDRIAITQGRKSRAMKNLLKHKNVYNADMDIVDRYIKNFME